MARETWKDHIRQQKQPQNVAELIVCEDLNETYKSASLTGLHESLDAEPVRESIVHVSRKLAEASLSLEHNSTAFITDASQS